MQKVSISFLILFTLLVVSVQVFAQEAFAPEQLYFQGEVIRKVSMGADGIWVIKGEDSTGLAKLDFQGQPTELASLLNITHPLTHIVGGYGSNAIFATNQHLLYSITNGDITLLNQSHGLAASKINDVHGTPGHTRVATGNGVYHSYDNKAFHLVSGSSGTEYVSVSENSIHYVDVDKAFQYQFNPTPDGGMYTSTDFRARRKDNFFSPPQGKIYAYEAWNTSDPLFLELLAGGEPGLFVNTKLEKIGSSGSYKEQTYSLLHDTTVYSLQRYKHLVLVGTEKGLYYYTNQSHSSFNGKITPVELNDGYIIYDIAVQQEEQIIWLATNKGLLKLVDNYKMMKSYLPGSLLWAKTFTGSGKEKSNTTATDADGNIYLTGYFSGTTYFSNVSLTALNNKDFYVAKLSAAGEVLWIRTAENSSASGYPLDEEGFRLEVDSQGNIYVVCHLANYGTQASYTFGANATIQAGRNKDLLLKYTSEGTLISLKELTAVPDYTSIQTEISGQDHLYISGTTDKTSAQGKFVQKFDADGNQLWVRTYPAELNKFDLGKEGNYYLSGYFRTSLQVGSVEFQSDVLGNLAVIHFDEAGAPLWKTIIKGYNTWQGHFLREIQADDHGNTYIGGDISGKPEFGPFAFDRIYSDAYFLTKLTAAGTFEWLRYSGGVEYKVGFKDLVVDGEGNSYITGECYTPWISFGDKLLKPEADNSRKVYLAKFDAAGTNIWAHALSQLNFVDFESIGKSLALTNQGVVLAASLLQDVRMNNTTYKRLKSSNTFLAEISDTYTETPFNLLKGRSYHDKNGNKVFDEGEPSMKENIIKIEPGPYYAEVDFHGNYQVRVGKGEYTVTQIIARYPDKKITQSHPQEAYTIELNNFGLEETGLDFANQILLLNQPGLTIDISASPRRRCEDSQTTIVVNNLGNELARNVNVVVEYPEYLIPKQSNYPWTKREGNTLTFTFNEMQANSSFWISIADSVSCGDESIRGLEQCVKTFIAPTDTSTIIHPDWDSSDIELTAQCKDNGFVRITLLNKGTGHMADSAGFRIFLDQALVYTGRYKLNSEESLSLNLLANGKPLLVVADLAPLHPLVKSVSVSVEGCNTDDKPVITHSLAHNFPQDKTHEKKKVVCLPVIDSFDPNDKLVVPAGITANHNISGSEYLEYTIRFQNTGTAPAINIKITDELNENLDQATLKIGSASHPVSFEKAANTLIWKFSNIYLPDSSTNEPGSHGFVKFRIKPKRELPKGTVIRNSAAIFFDYNSPIETNEVFHTIGLPELVQDREFVAQACNTRVVLEQPAQDQTIVLCDEENHTFSLQTPSSGKGMWKLSKGTGTFKNPFNAQTFVSGLSFGENEFIWEVTYCDQKVSSKVTIIREQPLEKPSVVSSVAICQGEPIPSITATGQGIEWYADAALSQLLAQGSNYLPSGESSEMLYVVQRNENCTSPPAQVSVVVHPRPEPPQADATEGCVDITTPVITAQGSNIRWYADAQKQQLLAEGNNYKTADKSSRTYYVTQSSEHCESEPLAVAFTAKRFDPALASIPNVVFPLGKADNQQYWIGDFVGKECMGKFVSIKIFNRWGKQVYESNKGDFKWDASQHPVGVYYYQMHYQHQPFYGYIQVLK